ncbi:MAG: signal peptidase I [Clostridia bacterium]|nr:signal peptidase I [Clostridia bacterium]
MKKALIVAKNVLVWVVVAIAVLMMIFTVVSVNTFDRDDRTIFGYRIMVVQTDSMSKTHFDAGDVIFSKEVDARTLKAGDVITFISQDPEKFGETVTHMIREVTKDENGRLAFRTYGTTTGADDATLVTASYVRGKYTGKVANLGEFFVFVKSTPGYIICILVPFLLLILGEGIRCIGLFRRMKKEQNAEIDAERAKIAEERAESQKMMAELLELKKQLAAQEAVKVEAEPVAATETTAEEPAAEEPAAEESAADEPVETEAPQA